MTPHLNHMTTLTKDVDNISILNHGEPMRHCNHGHWATLSLSESRDLVGSLSRGGGSGFADEGAGHIDALPLGIREGDAAGADFGCFSLRGRRR